jgi:MFS family permease
MSLKKYFLWSILIINSVMVIAIATGTSLKSYDWTKIGYTGWFFAGNEIGAILAILFPVTLTYAILETKTVKYIYYWIPVVLTGFSLVMLGTKVGYGALFIGLFVSLFICFINWFLRKNKSERTFLTNGIISFILFIVLIVITPFTPIFSNTFAHLELLEINFDNSKEAPENNHTNDNNINKGHVPEVNKEQVENLILSSRDVFLKDHQNQFKAAPIMQKLFGMGYSGNYEEAPKMIEMDFYDLFYSLGILGFIVYLLPFLVMLYKIGIFFLRNIKFIFESGYLFFLLSIFLGLGISYTAGHVLTAPAVSIYFSIVIAFLFVESKKPLTKTE